jgi:hypothetical protein
MLLRALAGAGLLLASLEAASAQDLSIRVPAYGPTLDKEMSYRVEMGTAVDSHGLLGAAGEMNGVFHDRVTALSENAEGFKMRWRIEAEAPKQNDRGVYDIFRDRLESFGQDKIAVLTDRRGEPLQVDDLDVLRSHVQAKFDQQKESPENYKARLRSLLARLQPGSLFPVEVIAPAARILAQGQQAKESEFDLGLPRTTNVEAKINEASVPYKLTTRVDRDEAGRVAVFRWTKVYDAHEYAEAWRESIVKDLETLKTRRPDLTPEKIAEFSNASLAVETTVRVSLDDGVAISGEEISENRVGPTFSRHMLRVERE